MSSRRHTALWVLLSVLGVAVAVGLLAWLPPELVPGGKLVESDEIRFVSEGSMRSAILQLAGGAILAIGIIYTAGQLRISRETHFTERYAKAVDQLGSDEKIVRVGAIFALRRLAANSAVDGPVVVEVLRSYLRLESARPPKTGPQAGTIAPDVQVALSVLVELNADGG